MQAPKAVLHAMTAAGVPAPAVTVPNVNPRPYKDWINIVIVGSVKLFIVYEKNLILTA